MKTTTTMKTKTMMKTKTKQKSQREQSAHSGKIQNRNSTTITTNQYAIVAKDAGVEISEESEGDIEVEPVANQVVEISAVHSELDYDQEEVENDNEEFERYNATVSEEPRAQIEEDPQS